MTKIVPESVGVPWFRPEDFQRIREICSDIDFATHEQWLAHATNRYAQYLAAGWPLEKVMVDPDELLAFAEERFAGKVDAGTRSAFAAFKIKNAPKSQH